MYINAHTLHMTGRRQRAEQTCKHSTNSLILFPALADQDEPVRGKHTAIGWIPLVPKTSHPAAGSVPWSQSWSPQLLANPQGLQPCCTVGMQTCTHTPQSPPRVSLRHWLYPAAGSRIPWSPSVLTHGCKLFSFSWSPDPRVAPGSLSSWLSHVFTAFSQTRSHAMSWLSNLLPYSPATLT